MHTHACVLCVVESRRSGGGDLVGKVALGRLVRNWRGEGSFVHLHPAGAG